MREDGGRRSAKKWISCAKAMCVVVVKREKKKSAIIAEVREVGNFAILFVRAARSDVEWWCRGRWWELIGWGCVERMSAARRALLVFLKDRE